MKPLGLSFVCLDVCANKATEMYLFPFEPRGHVFILFFIFNLKLLQGVRLLSCHDEWLNRHIDRLMYNIWLKSEMKLREIHFTRGCMIFKAWIVHMTSGTR